MNQTNLSNQTLPSQNEVNFLDYCRVAWKRRWVIGGICSLAGTAALISSLLLPKIYVSTATLLPQLEKEGGGLSGLLAASGAATGVQSLGISLPGTPATPTDILWRCRSHAAGG